ncbi:thioesterase [Helicobacter sp. MIT 00-7814]|uniref:PaaI family thioesterase n=1 Tax=unclassified Helicobacter TaxID=2593540 RepID=UPI000E1F91FB|nr:MULTISPECIES: PaaI family thioesterase [unclassified Helicobacter]RDU56169.1 thioesterase [Helicobacter sp. MIT 99-10781]RDU56266.1 thioesterase [Helicobacter sp. MIT 00-7814]
MDSQQEHIDNDELLICTRLHSCGDVIENTKGKAHVRFVPDEKMIADIDGSNKLIHSGYLFSAASYAAMVAINKRHSIMIAADVKFLSPIELGHEVFFKATALQNDTKKCEVKVEGFLLDIKIFDSIFHIAVFDKAPFSIALEKLDEQ